MIFVTLMLPRGKGTSAVKYLTELKAPKGIEIRDIFFAFGKYDAMIIFEAPNERTAMNFVMETGFATEYIMETMIVIPAEEIASARAVCLFEARRSLSKHEAQLRLTT